MYSGDNLGVKRDIIEGKPGSEVRLDPEREGINGSQRNLKPLDVLAPVLQATECEILYPEEGLDNQHVPG